MESLLVTRGNISQPLFERLFVDGIQLVTKLKSNMKGAMMSVSDRPLLRETVNDDLKKHCTSRTFQTQIF